MHSFSKAALGGALALVASALIAGPAAASPGHREAVFVQNDNPDGNAIAVYDRSADGRLRAAGTYPTGGRGGVLEGSVVDHLASQDSLNYDRKHRLLYAVNAGSNTITVFDVHGDRLVRRQVVPSGGDFPVSVTVHDRLVYVLNARDGGSIQGYRRVGRSLIPIASSHRDLRVDTTQTPEFTHTPGQVAFSPDGSQLLVTTKGASDAIDVFKVASDGSPSAAPVVNSFPGDVPFAIEFDRAGRLLATEAGPNAVESFALRGDGTLDSLTRVPTGQAATCWILRIGPWVYVSNAGSATVSRFDSVLTALGNTATGAGTVDAAATPDGRFLYVQTGAAGNVDAFRVAADGSLSPIGSVTVPGAIGGEGIAAS